MHSIDWKKFLLPYDQAAEELKVKFENLAKGYRKLGHISPIERVEVRVKSVSSILDKATKKKIPLKDIQAKIEDITGVRIICRFVEDIDKIIQLIRDRDGNDLFVLKERDYVKNQKASGYRSYHIIISYKVFTASGHYNVPAEIQIRTMSMNSWAVTEHSLKYKYRGNIPEALQNRLCAAAEAAFKLDREMGKIRGEILEAQKSIQTKTDLVDEILSLIQSLHYVANLDRINELNKHFFTLYKTGDTEELKQFNDQLKLMAELYKVQLV